MTVVVIETLIQNHINIRLVVNHSEILYLRFIQIHKESSSLSY